ncbi:MAG: undecaprenyl-diphosphate phosphatase [Candidatus Omnitrophica bacterium]|nr:undecaprenyl-diphosphate phosphatase [Candidatus Omnitrophota bacterium]
MIKYILLGIIQGLTEFLPVSSSGHLVIAQRLFGFSGEEIAVSVILHLGTLFAVIIFFFGDIIKAMRDLKLIWFIVLTTFITGVIGILGRGFFEGLFNSPKAVIFALFITGVILLMTRRFPDGKKDKFKLKDALILGLTQAVAIVPGISRSGITISTLLFRGGSRETCFKLSFLVSIPLILGAALLEFKKIDFAIQDNPANIIAGFIASLISGLLSLFLLKLVIKCARFYYFGYYCILVAVLALFFIK